jgi:spore germination cell wall hydrolase CwlJ-like protein
VVFLSGWLGLTVAAAGGSGGVVWQSDQFSWTNHGRSDRIADPDAIGKAVDIALAAPRGKVKDPTGGALHFYAHDKVKPRGSSRGFRLIVGEHTFMRLTGKWSLAGV